MKMHLNDLNGTTETTPQTQGREFGWAIFTEPKYELSPFG